MKPLFLLLFLFLIHLPLFSQQTNPRAIRAEYLEKRLKQKRTGWILLGGGLVMTASGLGINMGQSYGSSADNDNGMGLFIVGAITTIVSIPFFIAAHKNKKRAAAVLVRQQQLFYPAGGPGFIAKTQPTLTLRVRL